MLWGSGGGEGGEEELCDPVWFLCPVVNCVTEECSFVLLCVPLCSYGVPPANTCNAVAFYMCFDIQM